jgi:hypothetical protein
MILVFVANVRLFVHTIEVWELLFQPIYCRAPSGRSGFANGVLVAKHAYLLNSFFQRNSLQPLDGYKVFTALGVIKKLAVILLEAKN